MIIPGFFGLGSQRLGTDLVLNYGHFFGHRRFPPRSFRNNWLPVFLETGGLRQDLFSTTGCRIFFGEQAVSAKIFSQQLAAGFFLGNRRFPPRSFLNNWLPDFFWNRRFPPRSFLNNWLPDFFWNRRFPPRSVLNNWLPDFFWNRLFPPRSFLNNWLPDFFWNRRFPPRSFLNNWLPDFFWNRRFPPRSVLNNWLPDFFWNRLFPPRSFLNNWLPDFFWNRRFPPRSFLNNWLPDFFWNRRFPPRSFLNNWRPDFFWNRRFPPRSFLNNWLPDFFLEQAVSAKIFSQQLTVELFLREAWTKFSLEQWPVNFFSQSVRFFWTTGRRMAKKKKVPRSVPHVLPREALKMKRPAGKAKRPAAKAKKGRKWWSKSCAVQKSGLAGSHRIPLCYGARLFLFIVNLSWRMIVVTLPFFFARMFFSFLEEAVWSAVGSGYHVDAWYRRYRPVSCRSPIPPLPPGDLISGYLRLSPAISGYLPDISRISCPHTLPAISGYLRLSPAISGYLAPGYLRLSPAISGYLKPCPWYLVYSFVFGHFILASSNPWYTPVDMVQTLGPFNVVSMLTP